VTTLGQLAEQNVKKRGKYADPIDHRTQKTGRKLPEKFERKVREPTKPDLDPSILKVSAYASYHPKSDVASDNRRVEMRFFSQDNQQDILTKENFFDRLE
jgi:hypothetical protein